MTSSVPIESFLSDSEAADAIYTKLRESKLPPDDIRFAKACHTNRHILGLYKRDLVHRTRWTGNKMVDYRYYMFSHQDVLSIFASNPFHPLSRKERIVIFICALFVAAFSASFASFLSTVCQPCTASDCVTVNECHIDDFKSTIFAIIFGIVSSIYIYALKAAGTCECAQGLPNCIKNCIELMGSFVMLIQLAISTILLISAVMIVRTTFSADNNTTSSSQAVIDFFVLFLMSYSMSVLVDIVKCSIIFFNDFSKDVKNDRRHDVKMHAKIRKKMMQPIHKPTLKDIHREEEKKKQQDIINAQRQQQLLQQQQQQQMSGIVPMQTFANTEQAFQKVQVSCAHCNQPFYITQRGSYVCPNCKGVNNIS